MEWQDAIQKLAGTYLKDIVSVQMCSVDSVDKDNRTCDCTPIGGNATTAIPKVRLMTESDDGFLVLPKAGSNAMVALSTRGYAYVFMFSQIDEVEILIGTTGNYTSYNIKSGLQQFNDGTFGGLIKIDNLKTQWDANVTAIKTAVAAAFAVVDTQLIAVGQAGGSAGVFNGSAVSIQSLNKTPLENTIITHGK